MRRLRHDYTSTVKTNLFSKTPHLHRKLISRNNFEEISSTYDDKTSILLSYKGILWTKNVYAKILDVSVHTDLLQPALSSRPGLRFGRANKHSTFIDEYDAFHAGNTGTDTLNGLYGISLDEGSTRL